MQSTNPTSTNCPRYILQVYVGALSVHYEALSVEASKQTTADEIVACIVERLNLPGNDYELAEVVGECKERRLAPDENPVSVMLLWPLHTDTDFHRFYLREIQNDIPWVDSYGLDPQIFRDFIPFLLQPENRDYPDLCQLPDLNESTLLENLRQRFDAGHIYTYVGSILIAVNPFKFHPIYNPKYVRLYQNQRVGPILPPHIFAIADYAYYCMLKEKRNQCVVISGESGSGKTESTNFLLHHLTALSQKGSHGSGVEQTILSAGPVLEAFGNAKTAHNNNSSRFGKFIQVNYRENGMVQGAVVQKYLLEKSRIVSQGPLERNYHVFYYLLSGSTESECETLHLLPAEKYKYLNSQNLTLENCDETYEFSRLKQSMEMVGFSTEKQRRLFNVLSAVLLLGNVEFFPKKSTYHHDESVQVRNCDIVGIISELLRVKQDTLLAALTSKRVKASGETLIMQYKLPEAIAARDALAKCLYGALFDWIVLQVNHALLNKDQTPHMGHSIGVLDIFGFEDFGSQNSFEQLCINYANEHLQYYFNLHVFKYEQNEYKKENIKWRDIEFMDNYGCLLLFETKPTGLLCILDDLCNFPGATNEALLQKFNSVQKDNSFYEKPQKKENAFIIRHYAGKVKYQVLDMREKNLDLMRQDIVSVLKNSSMAFVRELVGADPVAVFRWAIIRAFFRGYFAFRNAGVKHRKERYDQSINKTVGKNRFRPTNEIILSKKNNIAMSDSTNLSSTTISGSSTGKRQFAQYPHQKSNQSVGGPTTKISKQGWPNSSGISNYRSSRIADDHINQATSPSVSQMPINNRYSAPKTINTSKFERSGQDVMARASQIVQKNKSFRPRERSKKGLKNLQTVKTLTAGQNLSSQSTVKTRKQPLTVTAQFQNSLTSLMDTLNQANPFFIRCIKSNSDKIPNKFDDVTVIRQLRYTGMLETVRIRRAGYNVRLTYEEFIQLYRILLPKGLISSQKDVRDFMNTMDLNKQHYQLGITKIYMRESQKMRLDIMLHTKITDSIKMIQRWFRSILQRRKFRTHRAAAITIQSSWRMYIAQKTLAILKLKRNAATMIQATWKMYKARRWFRKLCCGITIVQAHWRGKLARMEFKHMYRQKLLKERYKLRPTQSLPANESVTYLNVSDDSALNKISNYTALEPLRRESMTELTHLHSKQEIVNPSSYNLSQSSSSTVDLHKQQEMLHKAEAQVRNLIISQTPSSHPNDGSSLTYQQNYDFHDYQNIHFTTQERSIEDSLHPPKPYGIDVTVKHCDDGELHSIRYDSRSVQKRRSLEAPSNREQVLLSKESDSAKTKAWPSDTPYSQQIIPNPDIQNWREYKNDKKSSQPYPVQAINYIATPTSPPNQNSTSTTRSITQIKSFNPPMNSNKIQNSLLPAVPQNLHNQFEDASYSQQSPRGKAAAFLGTIAEDMTKHNRSTMATVTAPMLDHTPVRRTTKSNFGDEFSTLIGQREKHASHQFLPRSTGILSHADSLRRRNSDPSTNKISLLDANRGNDMYQSSTHINIAGHRFRKAQRIGKAEKCASCQESDAFVNEGHRCLDCKVLVHTKCIQNGGVKTLQCEAKRSKRVRSKGTDKSGVPSTGTPNSKYSGTREYTDSTDKIISDAKELQSMQTFITQKICKMDNACENPSEIDRVFKQALREFKDNLVAQYSVAHKQNSDTLNIKYRDLIANFEQVMETCCGGRKDDFPLTMGVNAFRGFMNEFMNSRETEKPKAKRKKEKKRKVDEHTNYNGHTFQLTIINIPTACEICQLFLLWPIERGLVCQNCRLTCHKKCYQKSTICNKISMHSTSNTSYQSITDTSLFGVPLANLCMAEGGKIPTKIEQLITKIEMHGLYAEGLYRKSGVNSKIKELKQKMSELPVTAEIDYESYNVHVLTNVLKSFLREMPEPLLSFDRYDDFLRASELSELPDRVSTLMSLIKKLPPTHHALLERLVFHLALVAQREQFNRMSASSLAIVFAPCVLRTNRLVPAQDSLNDIGRQTKCIETLITQKMMNVKTTLADIDTLDTAAHTASTRLSTLRSSKVFDPEEFAPRPTNIESDAEEMLLEDHIQEIKKEKAMLTSTLPSLARASSDDDLLSTDMDGEGGSLDDLSASRENPTFDSRDLKDSIDSSCGSLTDTTVNRRIDYRSSPVQIAITKSKDTPTNDISTDGSISYNLREQNIEYIPSNPVTIGGSGQKAVQQSDNLNISTSKRQIGSLGTARWTGSQQNIYSTNYAIDGGSGQAIDRVHERGQSIDLQRQKPLAVRSMSSGYEQTLTVQSMPGLSAEGSILNLECTNTNCAERHSQMHSTIGRENRSNNNNRKTKKRNSLDDEPIMV